MFGKDSSTHIQPQKRSQAALLAAMLKVKIKNCFIAGGDG